MQRSKHLGIIGLLSVFCLLSSVTRAYASITLRVMAVNPSEESSQPASIKVYLPMEVKPEDIIYKGDLEVAYDTQQGSYYVFGEYELKPKEVMEKEVELKDIWVIDEAEIISLHKEAKEIYDAFAKTSYAEKAAGLYKNIEDKLAEVDGLKKTPEANPAQHISNYRYSAGLLASVKQDIVSEKTLLAEIEPKGLAGITWKLIVFIIVFLGILGLGFYIIWQRQAKIEAEQKT